MAEQPAPDPKRPVARTDLPAAIGAKERRRLRARRHGIRSIWLGFSMMGLVGWSVAVPCLIGIALGIWIDAHHMSRYSWTLMLLVLGLLIGCYNAWYWVSRESEEIRKEQEQNGNT